MNLLRYFPVRSAWMVAAAACALACASCGHKGSDDPAAAINLFFATMSQQHYQQAYDSAASAMKIQFSEAAFEALARDLGLGNFTSCTWKADSVTKNEAVLNGEFVAKNNDKTHLRATMLRETGQWRLYLLEVVSLQDPNRRANLFNRYINSPGYNDAVTRKIPNEFEIRKLVSGTMDKFNECLHKRDFKPFYDASSTTWQLRTTEEQVDRAFKPYIDNNATLDLIKDVKAIFDEPPRLNSDGYLVVNGYYPTQPRVIFHLQYTFELPLWKIVGVTISIQP